MCPKCVPSAAALFAMVTHDNFEHESGTSVKIGDAASKKDDEANLFSWCMVCMSHKNSGPDEDIPPAY